MADMNDDPVETDEPKFGDDFEGNNVWMRGLWMLILALMFALAETVLAVVAVVQFLWILFAKEKNELLMDFGHDLGTWLQDVARFQSGATEAKPFPWKKWG